VQLDKIDLAIIDFSTLIKCEPKNSNHYYSRAVCYHKIENFKLAIIDLNYVIENFPTAKAYFNRGNIFYKYR
jgi:tetratricopeptide (TPR) repeat protein